jgi:hypothetical protein
MISLRKDGASPANENEYATAVGFRNLGTYMLAKSPFASFQVRRRRLHAWQRPMLDPSMIEEQDSVRQWVTAVRELDGSPVKVKVEGSHSCGRQLSSIAFSKN